MLATPINNTLHGCKNWRLAKANTHRMEQDAPEDNSISKMYFGLWKTPGVSERMWSVNFEVSISGEY